MAAARRACLADRAVPLLHLGFLGRPFRLLLSALTFLLGADTVLRPR